MTNKIHKPKTRKTAGKYVYRVKTGQTMVYKFDQCAAEITTYKGRAAYLNGTQCSRRPGYGPGKLYCKQHAKLLFGE